MTKNLLPVLFVVFSNLSFAQNAGLLKGIITDKQTNEVLSGAAILIKGTSNSAVSDNEGYFVFPEINSGQVVVMISFAGYITQELTTEITSGSSNTLNIQLMAENRAGDEVVISASKRREKITNAPASIHIIGLKDLNQFAGSNVNELVAKVQGVEYTRSGVDEITFNARGMNGAFNIKVFQLVDGRNSMTPLSGGLPIFNNGSTNKEDIKSLEIILGPQSALYGPNAHNALFNYITKDPRRYQGTTISVSAGSQNQFSSRFRHALKINNKWAYKITGEHATGKDYKWYDTVYAGNPPPGNIPIPERINDFAFRRFRGEAHLYYTVASKTDIILSAGGSQFTRLQVTTTGRNRLRDLTYGFLQARVVHPRFFATIYNSWGNLGNTLNIYNYTRDFWNMNRTQPADSAERFATRLGNTVKEKSQRLNAEAQYNYFFENAGLQLVAGATFQNERPNSFGIGMIDSFQRIIITQYGAVMQLEKKLPFQIRFITAMRYDHHSNLGNFFSPRVALVKTLADGNFRITWGRAYSMPSIINQYAGVSRFLFGNGRGIYYIPNGTHRDSISQFKRTTPLRAEEVKTWEFGYKGTIAKKLYIDINYYTGISKNFISPPITFPGRVLKVGDFEVKHNPQFAGTTPNGIVTGAQFLTYINYGDIKTYGLDIGLNYSINKYFNAGFKYSWFGSDITKDNIKNDANKDNYVSPEERSMNAPKNRGSLLLNFQNLVNGKLFANITVRYVQQYDFYSGSQIGTAAGEGRRGMITRPGQPPLLKNFDWGPLGGFTTVDLGAGYKFNEMASVNMGITNLFNTKQIEFVGSPSIGRLFMVELKVHVPSGKKRE